MTHIRLSGHGSPVVLEPGLGASSVGWSRLHELLAERTRVVSYDRAGLGTTPPTPGPRDLTALAADLAQVITTVGEGPSVVVGHSLGGTIARQLAATRPDLVAGLVLVDPIPDDWVLRHAGWAGPPGALMYLAMQATAHIGLIDTLTALPLGRAIVRSSTSPLAALSERERDQLAAELRRPTHHRTARAEFTGLLHSRSQLRALAATPPAVPLTVISGTKTHRLGRSLRRKATAWHARLASAGRHIIAEDGDHFIPRYQPEIVRDAVTDLLLSARLARYT
ncbi:MAG TPA: alpha/beta hydrolase [Pseudonocardiaceae bacterium]|nr:alpha/beta hydrolase [Pseudonocardiaceae bacterium]